MYQLAMKRAHNNYLFFDVELLECFNNEDMKTIEGIDEFTSKFASEDELKNVFYENNFIEAFEVDNPLLIVFYEKGKWREEKFGIVYKQDKEYIKEDKIKNFILDNINEPLKLNKIYNKFNNNKNKTDYFEFILNILKNIKVAIKDESTTFVGAVNYFSYLEKRDMGMFIKQEFSDIINKNIKGDDNIGQSKILRNR